MKHLFNSLRSNLNHVKNTSPSHTDTTDADEMDFALAEEDYENNIFLNSLELLCEEDVPLSPAAGKRKRSAAEIFRIGMFYVSAFIFVISCIMLVQNLIDRHRGDEIYKELQNTFFGEGFDFAFTDMREEGDAVLLTKDSEINGLASMTDAINRLESGESVEITAPNTKKNEELAKMRAQLQTMAVINEDIYGWIFIEGTSINYPLVQGEDNDFYLEHAFTGDYLPIGSIFVDYRNNKTIMKNYNTVFYGHNITSGSMFHDVEKFFEDEYFHKKRIYVYTFDGIYIYEPFAVYQSRYDNNYFKTGFTSFDDFIAFTEQVKNDAVLYKDVEFKETDRMITLSTCTNGAMTDRYALHAKLVDYIVD